MSVYVILILYNGYILFIYSTPDAFLLKISYFYLTPFLLDGSCVNLIVPVIMDGLGAKSRVFRYRFYFNSTKASHPHKKNKKIPIYRCLSKTGMFLILQSPRKGKWSEFSVLYFLLVFRNSIVGLSDNGRDNLVFLRARILNI